MFTKFQTVEHSQIKECYFFIHLFISTTVYCIALYNTHQLDIQFLLCVKPILAAGDTGISRTDKYSILMWYQSNFGTRGETTVH
jgi:hypothetical protein